MGKAIIKVEHLKKYFKDVKAVDDVSFEVRDGELFSFLGLNGAGKSTTIDIISGVREKDSGEVVVDGVNIDYDLDAVKSKLGVVFQGSALDKELSAGDNLRYRAALYGLTGKRYSETLDDLTKRLDLKGLLRRPLGKLSGGQRRRIDIARALLHRPKILILDEPANHLDLIYQKHIFSLIETWLRQPGRAVVSVVHDLSLARKYGTHAVLMHRGQCAAQGKIGDVMTAEKLQAVYEMDVYGWMREMLGQWT